MDVSLITMTSHQARHLILHDPSMHESVENIQDARLPAEFPCKVWLSMLRVRWEGCHSVRCHPKGDKAAVLQIVQQLSRIYLSAWTDSLVLVRILERQPIKMSRPTMTGLTIINRELDYMSCSNLVSSSMKR